MDGWMDGLLLKYLMRSISLLPKLTRACVCVCMRARESNLARREQSPSSNNSREAVICEGFFSVLINFRWWWWCCLRNFISLLSTRSTWTWVLAKLLPAGWSAWVVVIKKSVTHSRAINGWCLFVLTIETWLSAQLKSQMSHFPLARSQKCKLSVCLPHAGQRTATFYQRTASKKNQLISLSCAARMQICITVSRAACTLCENVLHTILAREWAILEASTECAMATVHTHALNALNLKPDWYLHMHTHTHPAK
jgi:hypothetical protein